MRLNKDQYTTRTSSILTGGEIEELHSIKNFPVFIGSTSDKISTDLFHDLTFDICKETGLIQLRDLIDSDIIYGKFHSEAIGEVWNKHYDMFIELLSKYKNNNDILEIGGSDSRLATKFLEKNNDVKSWIIIEPSMNKTSSNPKIKYILT